MPGGPSISSVFPELKPRRRVSCPGAVGAAGPELQMLRSGKHRGTCSTHRSLTPAHSPVLRMFRSKISTIRLRHLLAQSNTHGAFSGILPEGQRHNWPAHGVVKVLTQPVIQAQTGISVSSHVMVNGDDLSRQLLATSPPSAMTVSGH